MCVKFQLSMSNSFRDMRGSAIYTRGAAATARPLEEKFSCSTRVLGPVYMRVKFQLSIPNNCRDMRGSQIYSKGRCTSEMPPSGKNFISKKCTWPCLNVRKISTLCLIVFEIWGSEIYARGHCTPRTPLAKKFSYCKSVLDTM